MNTIFELAGKILQKKILLKAQFDLGRCGTIDIYVFDKLKLEKQHGERVYFEVSGGKQWDGGQEPIYYSSRERQPYDRLDQTTYIPHSFDDLDEIPTSDGSRFFSLKRAWSVSRTFTSADNWTDREVAVILSDRKELDEYLDTILDKMGVPTGDDIRQIKKDILAKLF